MKKTWMVIWLCMILSAVTAQQSLNDQLLEAVKNNNFNQVKELVGMGADVNYTDSNNAPVLMWAAYKADLKMVKYLVGKGADVSKKGVIHFDEGGWYGNLTGIAASKGNLDILQFLIEKCRIDASDKELDESGQYETNSGALQYSLNDENPIITNYLLQKNTALNALQVFTVSSFFGLNNDESVLKRLKDCQNDSLVKEMTTSILFLAIQTNNIDIVKHLLSYSPDFNRYNIDSLTVLAFSIVQNRPEIARLLVKNGAPVNQLCYDGKTPLFFAIEINDTSLIQFLLSQGADINYQDKYGRTPLFFSILDEKVEMAKYLLKNNADALKETYDGDSPFLLSKEIGCNELSDLLMTDYGVDYQKLKKYKTKLNIPPSNQSFYSLKLSPDNKFFAAESSGYIYIWETYTGKLIRVYPSDCLGFTLLNRTLVKFLNEGKIEYFSIQRNERIKFIDINSGFYDYLIKEKIIICQPTWDDTTFSRLQDIDYYGFPLYGHEGLRVINYFDLITNKIVLSFSGELKGLSADGSNLVLSQNDTLYYINILSHRKIKLPLYKTHNQMDVHIDSYFPSNNGMWLFYTSNDRQLPEFIEEKSDISVLYNINDKTSYKISNGHGVSWFSNDGELFATSIWNFGIPGKYFQLYKLSNNGNIAKDLEIAGVHEFCPWINENELALCFNDGTIKILDIKTKQLSELISGEINLPIILRPDPTDNIKIFSKPATFFTWELKESKVKYYRTINNPYYYSRFYSNNDFSALIALDTSLYNVSIIKPYIKSPEVKKILNLDHRFSWDNLIRFSPDNEHFVITTLNSVNVHLLDGKRTNSIMPYYPYATSNVVFSMDGSLMALTNSYLTYDSLSNNKGYVWDKWFIKIMSVPSYNIKYSLDPGEQIIDVIFSVDNEELWIAPDNGRTVKIYDLHLGSLSDSVILPGYEESIHSEIEGITYNSMKFVHLNYIKEIIVRTNDRLYWIDPLTKKLIKVRTIESQDIMPVFSTDQKWYYYISSGGAVNIWDIENDRQLCSIYFIDSSDYVTKAPNGLFDASPGAMNKMSYVAGMETIDLDQLKSRYYQPGLLQILLGYKDEPLRDVEGFNEIELYPSTKLQIIDNTLDITLENRGGGIGEVSLYLDYAEKVADLRPVNFNPDTASCTLTFDLAGLARYFNYDTTNVISVITKNKEGYLRSRHDTVHFVPNRAWGHGGMEVGNPKSGIRNPESGIRNPGLYAVVAGIADYAGEKIDLRFAGKDAAEFAHALQLGAENLFGPENVYIHLLTTDSAQSDYQPTKSNIIGAFDAVSDSLAGAGPEDLAVVFLAGHGINYGGPDGSFYYLTQDAFDTDQELFAQSALRDKVTISSSEFIDLINHIPARKKVLILDVCAAGRAAEQITTGLRDVPGNVTRVLDNMQDRTGIYILAGCEANAVSYENTVYGQGLLTYSLLSAMKGNALKMDAGEEYVDVNTLLQYARDQVPVLSGTAIQRQTPFIKVPDNDMGYYLGRMTEETKEQIKLSQPKPVFTRSRFQMEDMPWDSLELEIITDKKLNEMTSRGKDAVLVYSDALSFPGSYSLSGSYTVSGTTIMLDLLVLFDRKPVALPVKITGTTTNLDDFARNIITRAYREVQQR